MPVPNPWPPIKSEANNPPNATPVKGASHLLALEKGRAAAGAAARE